MDFEDLKVHPATGRKYMAMAKELVHNCVKVKEEKENKTTFTHRGFYGSVDYWDLYAFISVRVVKKLPNSITDADYELADTVNKSGGVSQGILEINPDRNTCSARAVLFIQAELDEQIFLGALNDCCDKLEAFFEAYNKQKSV